MTHILTSRPRSQSEMKLSIIAAMAGNRVIGRNNRLPWKLPADLKRFKTLTMGHYLLVGRKTYESIGRPLPGRTMVVITRQENYASSGVCVAHSFEEALQMAAGNEEIFIAGGAQIYEQALPRADRLYLTRIHGAFQGDTYFPRFDESKWRLISRTDREADEENSYPCSFLLYERDP
jgi:dihydrofolate reductase